MNNIKRHARQIPFSSFASLYSEFKSYIKDSTIFFRYARQSSKHKTNIMRSVHTPNYQLYHTHFHLYN